MKSGIKSFRVDVEFKGEDFNWDEAKAEVLRQFDEWREKEKPTIFSVNFGSKTYCRFGQPTLDPAETTRYWYIEVLYCK